MRKVTLRELLGRELNYVERRYAPNELYVKGVMKLPLKDHRVSVIGTRHPSIAGLNVAKMIVERLVKEGVIIVSGLARGIDTVAHVTAIEHGGTTIAVLGTPLGRFYPIENKELQLKIMREHLAVSQFPPNHAIMPSDFLARDRTIVLISNATVIAEAGPRGGSVFTGWEAIRLGRPLFIWKDTYDNPNLLWMQEMKKNGAKRLNEETIDELLTTLS